MELLDNMLWTGQLYRFVSEMVKTVNEELEEKALWEFWLHKDWERSWKEFRESLNGKQHNAAPTRQDTLDILNETMNIMASFRPDGGGEQDESISSVRGDSNRRDEGEQNP